MLGVGRDGPRGNPDLQPASGVARIGEGREGIGAGAAAGPADASWPVDAAEREAWVMLNEAEGVGPVSFARLLEAFGSASAVLRESTAAHGLASLVAATIDDQGGSPSLTHAAARSIADLALQPERVLGPVRRAGVVPLLLVDEDYPGRLRQVALPPPVLFVAGSAGSLGRARAVAIVGTRRPTELGRATAGRIADAVADLGATIVSGLALGIDAAAHRAAVRAGRPTVAVIGGGHGRLYPAAHRGLVEEIVRAGGAVVSEFAPDTVPTRGTFPRRNRIISGLADATVVVEAGARSGALTTAAWALEQGRGLHIVPGRLDDPAVAGCLAFLREAGPEARIVVGIPELLDDLGLLVPAADPARRRDVTGRSGPGILAALPPVERAIATNVIAGRSSVDELAAATDLGGATVLGALTALEMRGLVVEAFGRYRAAGPLAAQGARMPVPQVRPRAAGSSDAAAGDAGGRRGRAA